RRIGAGTRARSARAVQSRIATPTGRRARDRAGRTSVDDTRVRFLEQSPQAAIPGPRPSRVALTELSTRGRYQSHRGGAGTGTRDPLDRGGAHPVLGPVGGIDPIVQGPIDVLEEHIGVDAARADVPREVVTGAPIPRGPGPVDGSDVELISLTHHPDDPGASQLPVISPGGDPQFRRVTDPVELVLGPPTHPCPPSIRDSTRNPSCSLSGNPCRTRSFAQSGRDINILIPRNILVGGGRTQSQALLIVVSSAPGSTCCAATQIPR